MRPRATAPAIALALGLAAACATPGVGPGLEPARLARGGEGERLYRSHCATCHRLRDPAEHTRERWAWALHEFGGRARLSADERPLVLAYLQSGASDAR